MDCENSPYDSKTNVSINLNQLLINTANTEEASVQLEAVQQCRELSCKENAPIDELTVNGVFPVIVHCLSQAGHPGLQLEAARVFRNIAAGTSVQTHKVIDAGAVPPLTELLKSPHDDVCEQAVQALGEIIGESPELRDRVIEFGLVESLLSLIKPDTPVLILRAVTAVVKKLFRCVNPLPPDKTVQGVLSALNELIMHRDNEILRDTVQTIAFILDGLLPKWDRIQWVIEAGLVPKVIPLLSHQDDNVQRVALEAVRNILNGTEEQNQVVLDCGVLPYFSALLSQQDETKCNLAHRALSFVIGSCDELHCQAVVDAGLLPIIVELLSIDQVSIQTAGARTVYNLSVFGKDEHVAYLINYEAVPSLCKLMTCEDNDIVNVVCLSLQYILKKAGARSKEVAMQIKASKSKQKEDVNALHIIEKDFAEKETDNLVKDVMAELENIAVSLNKNLTQAEENRRSTDFKKLLTYAADADNKTFQLAAVREFKIFISSPHCEEFQIDDYIELGLLPVLVQALSRDDYPELQLEAAISLINIAAGASAHVHKVVEAGALPHLIGLLKSPRDDVCEHALWALGNIIDDGAEVRDRVIELGLEVLLNLLQSDVPVQLLRKIARVIEALCCEDKAYPLPVKLVHEIIPVLNNFIVLDDCEALKDALSAMNYLFEGDNRIARVQLVSECGMVPKLVPLLAHEDEEVQEEASRAICYIGARSEEQKQAVLDCGALSHFHARMSHKNKIISRNAVCTLANILAGNERQRQAVLDAGLLPEIVELLAMGDTETQRVAASAVYNLSVGGSTAQVAALIDCGVVTPLCDLLTCAETRVVVIALNGLTAVLKNAGEKTQSATSMIEQCGAVDKMEALQFHEMEQIYTKACDIIKTYFTGQDNNSNVDGHLSTTELEKLVKIAANGDDPADQLIAVQHCRKLSEIDGEEHPFISQLIESGILPVLIHCVSSDDTALQLEATWLLSNIVTDASNRQAVVSAGAVPPLIKLLGSANDVSEKAAWSLGHIIEDSPALRDHVIELGVVELLLRFIKLDTPVPFLSSVIWVVAKFFKCKTQLPPAQATHKILSTLDELITYNDSQVKLYTSTAIANLLNGHQHCERIQLVIESGVVGNVTSLLAHEDEDVQHVAALIIGIIVTGTEEQKRVMLDCGALSHFPALLSHQNERMRKHAVLILSDMISNKRNAQAVVEAGLLPGLAERLAGGPLETRRDAARVVHKASRYVTTEQAVMLVSCGVVPALCSLLTDADPHMVQNVLESLINLLKKAGKLVASEIEECGGVDRIEALRSHQELEISKKARRIMEKYFNDKMSWWRCCYAPGARSHHRRLKELG